jgi:hypothetical protein
MRCWDLQRQGINTLVHYADFENPFARRKSWMLALEPAGERSAVVLHPVRRRGNQGQIVGNGSIDGDIAVFSMLEGARCCTLEGHWEPSTCACAVDSGGDIQVLTGGNDGMISRWRFARGGGCGRDGSSDTTAGAAQSGAESSMASVWAGGENSSGGGRSGSSSRKISPATTAAVAPDQDNWSDSSDED